MYACLVVVELLLKFRSREMFLIHHQSVVSSFMKTNMYCGCIWCRFVMLVLYAFQTVHDVEWTYIVIQMIWTSLFAYYYTKLTLNPITRSKNITISKNEILSYCAR